MTKKDYELIAKAINKEANSLFLADRIVPADPKMNVRMATWAHTVAGYIAQAIADNLEADNLRFDRDKFLKACGVTV